MFGIMFLFLFVVVFKETDTHTGGSASSQLKTPWTTLKWGRREKRVKTR
jgi:hypothetical protein